MACQFKQSGVISYEDTGEYRRKQIGGKRQQDTGAACQKNAFLQHILKFGIVAGTEMIADYRSGADGIADINGDEYELYIHQDAVCRHAVFTHIF